MSLILSGEQGVTFNDGTNINTAYNLCYKNDGSSIYGLIHNLSDDTFKRFGTGTIEDDVWLGILETRLNDNSNNDPVTLYFDKAHTVQGNMKRVVVNNDGYVKDYNARDYSHPDQTGLLAAESVAVQMPKFYYIDVNFTHDSKQYRIMGQSLEPFTLDLATLGFEGASSIVGMNLADWKSYSSINGTVVEGIIHNAFVDQSNTVYNWMYRGAWKSYEYTSGKMKSTCTTTGTATPVKCTASQPITSFRTKHQSHGSNFRTQNYFQMEALILTAFIERGTTITEVNGTNTSTKWEGYSWRAGATSDDQNLGLTLSLGNKTGIIKDTSSRTIANSYRGIEGWHSHLWEYVDGINIINNVCWVAKSGNYTSDVTTSPYFSSTKTLPGSDGYIKQMHAGTFIPMTSNGGATSLTGYTDNVWQATGNRVLYRGGSHDNPRFSGLFCWNSSNVSSNLNWNVSSVVVLLK